MTPSDIHNLYLQLVSMSALQNLWAGGLTRRHVIVSLAGIFTLIAVATYLTGIPLSTSRYPVGWQDRDPSPLAELETLGDALHLTQDQCGVLFPRLYHEADRAAEWTKRRGGITLQDLDRAEDKGAARLLIWRNRVGTRAQCRRSEPVAHDHLSSSTCAAGTAVSIPALRLVLQRFTIC